VPSKLRLASYSGVKRRIHKEFSESFNTLAPQFAVQVRVFLLFSTWFIVVPFCLRHGDVL
jgi:hypothetical protein